MRGREEPPSSEGGSHWRVAEKDMRSATFGFSGIVGGAVCQGETNKYMHRAQSPCILIFMLMQPFRIQTHQLQKGAE